MTSIPCPLCDGEFRDTPGQSASGNVIYHMWHVHHISANAAREILKRRGLIKEGYVIDDQALADWDAMVQAGVIE